MSWLASRQHVHRRDFSTQSGLGGRSAQQEGIHFRNGTGYSQIFLLKTFDFESLIMMFLEYPYTSLTFDKNGK